MPAPSAKEAKEINAFLATKRGVILDTSSTSRPAIRKLMSTYGVKTSNIEIVETFKEAEEKINALKPEFVWCEYELPKNNGLELFTIYKKAIPNRLQSTFVLLSDKTSPVIASRAAEEDADALIIRPFTFDDLQNKFFEILALKMKPTNYAAQIENAKPLLAEGKYQEALTAFTKAKALDPKPSNACFYMGQAQIGLKDFAAAENLFTEGLKHTPNHYKCLAGLFELKVEKKENDKAYEIGKNMFTNFPPNPKYIPRMVWLAVYNKQYDDIMGFNEVFQTIENADSQLINSVSAGLVICGKYLMSQKNQAEALNAFKKAEQTSKNKPSIIKEIILTLLNSGLVQDAQGFVSRAPDEVKNSPDVILGEFQYLISQGTPTQILTRGQELLKSGLKDFIIFEQVLKCSVELKRSNAVLDDLLSNSIQAHPDKKDVFEALIKK